jgi:hypothetical protein
VLVSFSARDKIPEGINLQEERFILVHSFRRFSLRLAGPYCFGPEAEQNIMVARVCGRGVCSPYCSQETNKKIENKGPGTRYSPQGHTHMNYSLQLSPPNFLSPPNNPSDDGLDQSPHGQLVKTKPLTHGL